VAAKTNEKYSMHGGAPDPLDALLAENKQLRDALAFYADLATYRESVIMEGVPIEHDVGAAARIILTRISEW
jgi:hypothetical protein